MSDVFTWADGKTMVTNHSNEATITTTVIPVEKPGATGTAPKP